MRDLVILSYGIGWLSSMAICFWYFHAFIGDFSLPDTWSKVPRWIILALIGAMQAPIVLIGAVLLK